MSSAPNRLSGLEVMRGIAASIVVVHHANSIIAQDRYFGHFAFGNHPANFNVGVDFFFVLSGFIIAWIHWGDLGRREQLKPYATKRILRIYPVYWAILIPLIASYFLFPETGLSRQRDPISIFTSLFLLPNPELPVLGVAWTLMHEMFFYALFGLLIWFGRKSTAILWAWAAAIIAVNVWGISLSFPFDFLFNPFNLEFLLGVALAVRLKNHTPWRPGLLLAAGTALFLYFMLFELKVQDVLLNGRLVFGSASALIIAGLVGIERRQGLKVAPAFLALGSASYAVYLAHPVLLSGFLMVLFKLKAQTFLNAELMVILLTVLAIAGGIGFHYLIEKPLTRYLRGLAGRKGLLTVRPQ